MDETTGILDRAQLELLRDALSRRAGTLRAEIGAVLGGSAALGLANRYDDVDDAAVADVEKELEIAGVDRDARELAEVQSALVRLGEPGFGRCAQCEEPIGWERLLARPQASRCVRCQSASERRQPLPSL